MSFLLRIYFLGMIAFVPGGEDGELVVLLADVRQGYATSDGTTIERHWPLFLARSGTCEGDCRTEPEDGKIAHTLYGNLGQDSSRLVSLLEDTIQGGGAWMLDSSDLSINVEVSRGRALQELDIVRNARKSMSGSPASLPSTLQEVEDFSWVAQMSKIYPEARSVDDDVLRLDPEKGLIVGRLKIKHGKIKTHRLVSLNDRIPVLTFRTLSGDGSGPAYSQALAEWTVAEIEVPGCSVEFGERKFGSEESSRVMKLSPSNCEGGEVVEVAVLNTPAVRSYSRAEMAAMDVEVAKHFEVFYELSSARPPKRLRRVPHVSNGDSIESAKLYGAAQDSSQFIEAILLGVSKGPVSPPICPESQFP